MKTREQAEQRANELFPKVEGNDHLWTSRVVVEREIKAFLQCWDEMQVAMDAKQADVKVEGVSDGTEGVTVESEGVSGKQTCGFCVKPKKEE